MKRKDDNLAPCHHPDFIDISDLSMNWNNAILRRLIILSVK